MAKRLIVMFVSRDSSLIGKIEGACRRVDWEYSRFRPIILC
jgi:hypothetical protein